MALACEPKLLIADEPTTALDVTIQAQILDLIDDLRQQLKMAVVLITHDMGVIAGRTDRVLVMYAGKIVEEAPTLELFTRHAPPLLRGPPGVGPQARPGRVGAAAQHRRAAAGPLPAHHHCRFAPRCRFARDKCWERRAASSSAPSAAAPPTWPPASTRWAPARSTPRRRRRPRWPPATSSWVPRSGPTVGRRRSADPGRAARAPARAPRGGATWSRSSR